jgi:hypothetical protein
MSPIIGFILAFSAMFGALLLMTELGRRVGARQHAPVDGRSAVDAAVFSLLALVLSFTFAGAASRFDARRQLTVQEANAIGTAYLRVNLLPAAMQPVLKQDYRDYTDARIAYYKHFASDIAAAAADDARVHTLQSKLWDETVAGATATNSNAAVTLTLSSLNDVIDITTTRAVATEMHPAFAIYLALGLLALAGAFLAGYGTSSASQRSWLHMFLFCGVLAMAIYTILDMEYPRFGLIRVDAIDHVLVDQRKTM